MHEAAVRAGLGPRTITNYARQWRALSKWCVRHERALADITEEEAAALYRSLTDGRSASHHLGVKAALRFVFKEARLLNPFAECVAPKFDATKIKISYLDAVSLSRLFGVLRQTGEGYFDQLTWTLACALFHTAARFSEWALLERESLVYGRNGFPTTARLRVKGGGHRDLPLPAHLGQELARWLATLDANRGTRLRAHDLEFASTPLVFPGRSGAPITNQFFNARLADACQRAGVTRIAAHGLRHSAATLLVNDPQHSLREVQDLLGHRQLATTARYTHVTTDRLRRAVETLSLEVNAAGGDTAPRLPLAGGGEGT